MKKLVIILICIFALTGCGNNTKNNNGISSNVKYYDDVKKIYFDAEKGTLCDNYIEENSQNLNTKGCLKWYAYSENKDGTINMLLDHDITDGIAWTNESTNVNGPSSEFINALKNATSSWSGVKDRKDKYSVDNGYAKYTIDYTDMKARLISAEEIKEIVKSNIDLYSIGHDDIEVKPWLFDRVSRSCEKYGCLNSKTYSNDTDTTNYWTSSPYVNTEDGVNPVNTGAYYVNYKGVLRYNTISDEFGTAIRPVISIDKDLIK